MHKVFEIPLQIGASDEAIYSAFLKCVEMPDQSRPGSFSSAMEGHVDCGRITRCKRTKARRGYAKSVVATARITEVEGCRILKGDIHVGLANLFSPIFFAALWCATYAGWIKYPGIGFVLYTFFFFWTTAVLIYDIWDVERFARKFACRT